MKVKRSAIILTYCTVRSIVTGFKMNNNNSSTMYDMVVIGGGSGGLACAKEAASFGKKVALLDFVSPSVKGTTWGLGGTCVNVGCIPKKLMHHIGLMREVIESANEAGWTQINIKPNNLVIEWSIMANRVQNYIKSLNWGHRVALRTSNVTYINAKARFINHEKVLAIDAKGGEIEIKSKYFVIAVGGRPKYPDIPGAREFGITSDDLFWLKKAPGKTLVIGGSYVALECAGFLNAFGYDTTVMIRSVPLRGFDQEMAAMVTEHMEKHRNIKFIRAANPLSVVEDSGRYRVKWAVKDQCDADSDLFDTVLFAVGREPSTEYLNLSAADVKFNMETKKIISAGSHLETTSSPNIFAIGDVIEGGLELTPVAIKAGKLLARRLFNREKTKMDYDMIPTTVFTPLEYACIGLSEEKAESFLGKDNIEVYHCYFKPLEFVAMDIERSCYMKLICDKTRQEKVLGLHILGPHAGEMLQGFTTIIKLGITRNQIFGSIGIHPTSAEEIVKMHITKRSGIDPHLTGC